MSSLYKQKAVASSLQSVAVLALGSNVTLPSTQVNKYVFMTSTSATNVLSLPTVGVDGSWISLHNSSSSNAFLVGAVTVATGTTANWMAVSGAWIKM
jgi:hypothetical protein